jgi:gluconolactonase
MTRAPVMDRRRMLALSGALVAVAGHPLRAAAQAEKPARMERPYRVLADGLRFPEGPIATRDGTVFVSEIARKCVTRIEPDGRKEIVASFKGGPNGLAFGPDGWIYVCNGGGFNWREVDGLLLPAGPAETNTGGWIERINPRTGEQQVIIEAVSGRRLRSPNDLVFDNSGGFWFTDTGVSPKGGGVQGGIYYARLDGSLQREAVFPLDRPNGIGLAPDGKALYVALTAVCDLLAYEVVGPGALATEGDAPRPGKVLAGFKQHGMIDSMAVEAGGNICATLCVKDPGLAVVAPDGTVLEHVPLPDAATTNLTFGGPRNSTAYVTQSSTGKLLAVEWPRPGIELPFTP